MGGSSEFTLAKREGGGFPSAPADLVSLLAANAGAQDEAWARFLRRYSDHVLGACRSVTKDPDVSMDHYAYVLEALRRDDCRRLRGYRPDGRTQFTTWLSVVCRRLCVDRHRSLNGRASQGEEPSTAVKLRRRLQRMAGEDLLIEELPAPQGPPTPKFGARTSSRVSSGPRRRSPKRTVCFCLFDSTTRRRCARSPISWASLRFFKSTVVSRKSSGNCARPWWPRAWRIRTHDPPVRANRLLSSVHEGRVCRKPNADGGNEAMSGAGPHSGGDEHRTSGANARARLSLSGHLDPGQVARMVDSTLAAAERPAVLGHLADCAECREEVRAVRALAASVRRRKRIGWGVPAAAAAALVLFTLNPFSGSSGPDPAPTLRNGSAESGLTAMTPRDGSSVGDGEVVEFRWSGDESTGPYVLVVSTLEGETVFTDATDSSFATMPIGRVTAGATYLWYVDGIARDTSRATTGVHRFTVRP